MSVQKKIVAIMPFISIIAFVVLAYMGYSHPGWLVFLLIPLAPFLVGLERIRFSYPLIVAAIYVVFGVFTKYTWAWHPGWVIFLTIPIYYILVPPKIKIFSHSFKKDNFFEDDSI